MKKVASYFITLCLLFSFSSCMKENSNHFPGSELSPYIGIYDVRSLYKGTDLTLTKSVMSGADTICCMVVSDHSGNNIPSGLLVVQDSRRLSLLRGISVNIGDAANNYFPGDSVKINIEGGVLKKLNGMLEITGISASAITKISSGNTIPVNRVASTAILANPDTYESVLCLIVKATYNPVPAPTDTYAGDKILNDGFGNIGLHTEKTATFANNTLTYSGNYYTIPFNSVAGKNVSGQDSLVPNLYMRTLNDVMSLGSSSSVSPIIISGFMADPKGTDANYEYIQLLATKDIDFSKTPYAVVTTNNAGASTPGGYPVNGWGTGGLRTYQFNLTSGTAAKGTFFYVGGIGKAINAAGSTSMASSNWIRTIDYTKTTGDGGNGAVTTNLLANSGNASGVVVFSGTTVDATTVPVDVIFVATGGTLYSAGPPTTTTEQGYRICNTDWYDVKNPLTLALQPYYREGTNTMAMVYPAGDMGYFEMLGGVFNLTLGKWTNARVQNNLLLTTTSPVSAIEGTGTTILKQ